MLLFTRIFKNVSNWKVIHLTVIYNHSHKIETILQSLRTKLFPIPSIGIFFNEVAEHVELAFFIMHIAHQNMIFEENTLNSQFSSK